MNIEPATAPAAQPTHAVQGRTHNGCVVTLDTFYSREDADADKTRRVFGAGDRYEFYRVISLVAD